MASSETADRYPEKATERLRPPTTYSSSAKHPPKSNSENSSIPTTSVRRVAPTLGCQALGCGAIADERSTHHHPESTVSNPEDTQQITSPPIAASEPNDAKSEPNDAASEPNHKAPPVPPAEPEPSSDDARWREIISTVTELAGIAALSAGFWLIRPWCGLIALGAGLIVLGIASSPRFDRKKAPR
jgi:hypothetical protein